MRAILRRASAAPEIGDRIGVDDVVVDVGTRSVTVAGREIALTGVEFSILEVLVRSAGCVVSRDELSQAALFRLLLLLHGDREGIGHAAVRDTYLLRWITVVCAESIEARQSFIGFFVRAVTEYYVLVVQLR